MAPCILSNHSGIKLEINSIRDYKNDSNTWRLNNTLLNDHQRNKGRNKTYLRICRKIDGTGYPHVKLNKPD
jgi:hypothetical protein